MNLRDVAYNLVHDYPGGASSLAPRVGKNAVTLSHELHGTGIAKLGLLDAEKITELTGDLRILQAFAANCGQMLMPLPGDDLSAGSDCMLRLAATVQGFGSMCAEVGISLVDDTISDNELARIDRECGQLIAKLHALRVSLAQRNQCGKR